MASAGLRPGTAGETSRTPGERSGWGGGSVNCWITRSAGKAVYPVLVAPSVAGVTPAITVATNVASTRPLIARKPAAGLPSRCRAASSAGVRRVSLRIRMATRLVSTGPAITRPTMTSTNARATRYTGELFEPCVWATLATASP